jgi:hypothetical protein
MRNSKLESLKRDVEVLAQDHEREVDRKDAIINMLIRNLEEADEQYARPRVCVCVCALVFVPCLCVSVPVSMRISVGVRRMKCCTSSLIILIWVNLLLCFLFTRMQVAQRSHMSQTDRLIGLHEARLTVLENEFEAELHTIRTEFEMELYVGSVI